MTVDISIERLAAADVIERSDDEGGYRLTRSFVETVQEYREDIQQAGTVPSGPLHQLECVSSLLSDGIDHVGPTVLAEYCAVVELADDETEGIAFTALLDQFKDPPPVTDGAPSTFLPVRGERLPFLVACYGAVVVYIWREDCPPCDVMVENFNEIFGSPPDDLLLLAVYGPDCPALLADRFDVVGAPTVLFARGGAVDSRFLGARDRHVLEREVETVRQLADG